MTEPQSYFPNDDDFNWNYGIAKAATGKFREAEEALSSIQNEKYRCEKCCIVWDGKGEPDLASFAPFDICSANFNVADGWVVGG